MNSFHPNILSIQVDDEFFDLIDDVNHIYFTDYTYLKPQNDQPIRVSTFSDNQLVITDSEHNYIEFCGDKWHRPITNIDEMKVALRDIINKIRKIDWPMRWVVTPEISSPTVISPDDPPAIAPVMRPGILAIQIDDSDVELLVEQVVFDLLFDKYIMESERMTRYAYANNISDWLSEYYEESPDSKSIDMQLSRSMDKYIDKMSQPDYKKQLEMLGIDPEVHNNYFNPDLRNNPHAKKPKFIWDLFFYNSGSKNIPARIYRRKLSNEDHDYSYGKFAAELKEYADFVNILLPTEDAKPKNYFNQSMEYYVLESYKRPDFILKLIQMLSKMGITEIDKNHSLVKRFHPLVWCPYLKNGKIRFVAKCKYYRPMFILEDAIAAAIQADTEINEAKYGVRIFNCQFARAKAYELFKYHYKYDSQDYSDIKEFLQQSYNLAEYHHSTKEWATFKKVEDKDKWKDLSESTKRKLRKQMKYIIKITEALFWKYSADEE